MASQAANAGSSGAGNSDSAEDFRLLEKYKSLFSPVLHHLKLEEVIREKENELAEERKKVETKDKEIQQLKDTTSEQNHQLECKNKLIDELKADMAKMETDFTAKLETEKKARRLQTIAVQNDWFLKLEQKEKVLTKLRKGEEEMRNEILKRDTTIKEQATKLESDREKLRKLEEKCTQIEENLNSEKEEFKLLQIQLEKKVTECSTFKTSAKKHEETIEALKKQLLDRENIQKRLEKMLRKKQSKIATLKDFVEERQKTRLEEEEKHRMLQSALSRQEDSDFEELNEDPAMSVEDGNDSVRQTQEEVHITSVERTSSCENESSESSSLNLPSTSQASSSKPAEAQESLNGEITQKVPGIASSISGVEDDNVAKDTRIDSVISSPTNDEEQPPPVDHINDQSEARSCSNVSELSEETHCEASSSLASNSNTCLDDAAGEHMTKANGNFPCYICIESFQRHCDRVKHLWRVHKLKNREIEGLFGCRTPGCGALLPSMKALLQHKRLAHNNDQPSPKSKKLRPSKRKKAVKIRDEIPGNSQSTSFTPPTSTWESPKHALDKSRADGFFCICGKEFHLKNCLAAHINNLTLEKKFACDTCGKKFVSYGTANAHKRSKHRMDTGPKGKIGCNFCGIVFPSKRCYAQHRIKKFINGKISGVYCPSQGHVDATDMETDLVNEPLNETPEMDGPFQQLGDELPLTSNILRLGPPTLEPETGKFRCNKCGKKFLGASSLSRHIICVHKARKNNFIRCKVCHKVFLTNLGLYHHHKMIHNHGSQLESWEKERMPLILYPFIKLEPDEIDPPSDDDTAEAEQQLQVADVKAESHYPVPLDPLDTLSGKKHKCNCGKMYTAKRSLRLHIQMKTNGKIFKCSWCSASFDAHSNLKKHVIRIHKRDYEASFACSECAQTFSTLYILRNHRQNVHRSSSRNQTKGSGCVTVPCNNGGSC